MGKTARKRRTKNSNLRISGKERKNNPSHMHNTYWVASGVRKCTWQVKLNSESSIFLNENLAEHWFKSYFSGKAKGIFFIKKDEVQIPKENFSGLMISGDLSQIPLEHLSQLVEEVFNDIFSHNDNSGTVFEILAISLRAGPTQSRTSSGLVWLRSKILLARRFQTLLRHLAHCCHRGRPHECTPNKIGSLRSLRQRQRWVSLGNPFCCSMIVRFYII